ncbi:hypothetical protein AAG906_016678 [Vitis piasezkii]
MVTNMEDWVVDFGATRHICGNKMHLLPTTIKEGDEQVFFVMFFMCRYSLELGISISAWEARSEDLV